MVKQEKQNLNKGDKRRLSILSSAMEVLLVEGYSKLTMRAVARKVGISLGNLQYYYKNREILVKTILENYIEEAILTINERLSTENQPLDLILNNIIDTAFPEQGDDACKVIYEILALSTRDKEASEILKNFYERYCSKMTELVIRIKPELSRFDAEKKAALLISVFEGLFVFNYWEDSTLPKFSDILDELKPVVKFIISS